MEYTHIFIVDDRKKIVKFEWLYPPPNSSYSHTTFQWDLHVGREKNWLREQMSGFLLHIKLIRICTYKKMRQLQKFNEWNAQQQQTIAHKKKPEWKVKCSNETYTQITRIPIWQRERRSSIEYTAQDEKLLGINYITYHLIFALKTHLAMAISHYTATNETNQYHIHIWLVYWARVEVLFRWLSIFFSAPTVVVFAVVAVLACRFLRGSMAIWWL